jgi:hypothetical protein
VSAAELKNVYVHYVMVNNDLGTAYDLIVQPQKRRLLRKILEAVIGKYHSMH